VLVEGDSLCCNGYRCESVECVIFYTAVCLFKSQKVHVIIILIVLVAPTDNTIFRDFGPLFFVIEYMRCLKTYGHDSRQQDGVKTHQLLEMWGNGRRATDNLI
jgi:hypothetical protein